LPPRVSVCFASSSVDVSISSPKWTRTPCPSLRTHHRRMRCQGSDGGDRTLTFLVAAIAFFWRCTLNLPRFRGHLRKVDNNEIGGLRCRNEDRVASTATSTSQKRFD